MLSRDDNVFIADTDVIIKRGIDTIRICVVPTKTNTKVTVVCILMDVWMLYMCWLCVTELHSNCQSGYYVMYV